MSYKNLKKMLILLLLLFLFSNYNSKSVIIIDANKHLKKDTTKLENTKWKLIAFVDVEAKKMREPLNVKNLTDPDRYTIKFGDTLFTTDTSVVLAFAAQADFNCTSGYYIVNYSKSTIYIYEIYSTGIHLLFENDEDNYDDCLYYPQEFIIYNNYLQLFYNDKKNYLLFERKQ